MKLKLSDLSPEGAPSLEGKRISIDPDTRRVAVRVASFGEVHSGFDPMVKVPRNVNLTAAHVGHATLDDGSSVRVATLPMHTVHAPKELDSMHAASWYENTGTAVARGRYSQDEEGIRFDGMLYDSIDESDVDQLHASSASGDWKSAVAIKRYEDFETTPCDFVGSCIVNIPGFSDTFAQSAGQRFSLAASAHSLLSIEDGAPAEEDASLTAASVGVDGLSDDDIRRAWEERNGGGSEVGPSDNYSWINEFYVAPQKIIVSQNDGYFQVNWGVAPDGTITFGSPVEVEKVWIAKESTVETTLAAAALQTLLAHAAGEEVDPVVLADAQAAATTSLTASGAIAPADPVATLQASVDQLTSLVTGMVFAAED